jgi:hypothetical protein
VLLSGARQIGKTTLMLQSIQALLASGVPAANILYATFDHPLLKLAGADAGPRSPGVPASPRPMGPSTSVPGRSTGDP